jgi:hypothetical protein
VGEEIRAQACGRSNELVAEIPRNRARIGELEARVAELERGR